MPRTAREAGRAWSRPCLSAAGRTSPANASIPSFQPPQCQMRTFCCVSGPLPGVLRQPWQSRCTPDPRHPAQAWHTGGAWNHLLLRPAQTWGAPQGAGGAPECGWLGDAQGSGAAGPSPPGRMEPATYCGWARGGPTWWEGVCVPGRRASQKLVGGDPTATGR